MPYNRPGRGVYVTNDSGGVIQHGTPVAIDNYVGVALKQKAPGWDSLVADETEIENGEQFFLITKGIVQVDTVTGFAKGDAVYIDDSTNTLTETSTDNIKFGRVHEVAGERGTPTGKVRIDLDAKDSF